MADRVSDRPSMQALREAQASLRSATERLTRHADGRRPTLPPQAAPFESATRMLSSVPVRRDFPMCAHCMEFIRAGGETDDVGAWFHSYCWTVAMAKAGAL